MFLFGVRCFTPWLRCAGSPCFTCFGPTPAEPPTRHSDRGPVRSTTWRSPSRISRGTPVGSERVRRRGRQERTCKDRMAWNRSCHGQCVIILPKSLNLIFMSTLLITILDMFKAWALSFRFWHHVWLAVSTRLARQSSLGLSECLRVVRIVDAQEFLHFGIHLLIRRMIHDPSNVSCGAWTYDTLMVWPMQ